MDSSINYVRKFIILKTQYSNMRDLNQKGHGKLEGKGQSLNISIQIQNAEATNYYDLLAVGAENAYKLGSIYTDENKNGEVELSLSIRELANVGFPIEKINGILIARNSQILLGGYFTKDDGTIENYIKLLDHRNTVENAKTEVEEVYSTEEAENIEEVETEKFDVEEVAEESPLHEEEINIPEELMAEEKIDIPEELMAIEKIDIPEELIAVDEIATEPIISTEEYSEALEEMFSEDIEQQVNMETSTDYVKNILNYFPYTEPFKISLGGYSWWKIDAGNMEVESSYLPFFDYILNRDYNHTIIDNYITTYKLIKNYGHYIFGIFENKDKIKLYIYGIPGKFSLDEYPQVGTTGFNTWIEGREVPGYWLLYMDPHLGRVFYPINPMIPSE